LDKIEVIVVNDGSRDNSLRIAREYESLYPDTIIVIDKENGGHGSTINAALKMLQKNLKI
jgi:glycosyltransferase involved in cell wall biosynthesis